MNRNWRKIIAVKFDKNHNLKYICIHFAAYTVKTIRGVGSWQYQETTDNSWKSSRSLAKCTAHSAAIGLFNARLCVSFTNCKRGCQERVLMQINAKGKPSTHGHSVHTRAKCLLHTRVKCVLNLSLLTNFNYISLIFKRESKY